MIAVKNLCKRYGSHKILDDISFQIEDGDFVSITGDSGSGKTTILNIIGLLDTAYKGTVEVDGERIFSKKTIQKLQREKFAYLFQNYALIENETVEQNLTIALKWQKYKNPRSYIKKGLSYVGLQGIEKKKIFELSGGEQQRVAMARVLLKKPRYVFADEPTGNLDEHNRDIVFRLLQRMNQTGCTVIYVTHDTELAEQANRKIKL